MLWSNVNISSSSWPPSRYKHSTVLCKVENVDILFLYGGVSGRTFQLKDLWKLELQSGSWTEIKPPDDNQELWPPPFQQHTLLYNDNKLYLFGEDVSIDCLCPLWIFDIKTCRWRDWGNSQEGEDPTIKSQLTPMGRKGHTAAVYNGYMLIYGGYKDLKGSLGDLWAFHFETETWSLFAFPPKFKQFWPCCKTYPDSRHDHSSVLHNGALYIYGGMTDLEERSDLWKFDIETKTWCQIKSKGPGTLSKHVAAQVNDDMFIFCGEKAGQPFDQFWKFSFSTNDWEHVHMHGSRPCERIFATCEVLKTMVSSRSPKKSPKHEKEDSNFNLSDILSPAAIDLVPFEDSYGDRNALVPSTKHKESSQDKYALPEINDQNYLLLVGGLEFHTSAVFKASNVSLWIMHV